MEPLLRTLFVNTAGTRLVLEGNAVKALRDDAPPRRLPLEALDTIVVTSGVDVSTPLLLHCAEAGRVVAFLSAHGRPRAIVEGAATGRADLRRRQYAAHADPTRRAAMAGSIVSGKIEQMAWGLRQWARDAAKEDQTILRASADELAGAAQSAADDSMTRESLLGIEGEATRRYFASMGAVVRDGAWSGRKRRPATDPFNALLSWLYGLTRVSVQGAVMVAGLDGGTGFLHGDRDGQPSLVLDLMEELRPVADRQAVRLWNTRKIDASHFHRGFAGAVEITTRGREVLFDAWHHHRAEAVFVRGRAQPVANGFIPLMQAHAMANALRYGSRYLAHRRVVR